MTSYFGRRVLRVKNISQNVATILQSEISRFLPLERVSITGDEVCIYVPNQVKNSVKQKMLSILNNTGTPLQIFVDADIEVSSTIVLVTNIPTDITDQHMDSLMRGFGRTLTKFQFILWEQLPYSKYGWIVFEDIRSAELCASTIPSTLINSKYLSCCLLPENVTTESPLKDVFTVHLEGLSSGLCCEEKIREILSITCPRIWKRVKFVRSKTIYDKNGGKRYVALIDWQTVDDTLLSFRKLDNFTAHKDAERKITLSTSLALPGISGFMDFVSSISGNQESPENQIFNSSTPNTEQLPPLHPRSPPPSYESVIQTPHQNNSLLSAPPMSAVEIQTLLIQQQLAQSQQHQQYQQQQQHWQQQHQRQLSRMPIPTSPPRPRNVLFPLPHTQQHLHHQHHHHHQQQQQPVFPLALVRPPVNVLVPNSAVNNGAIALAQLASMQSAKQPVFSLMPLPTQQAATSNSRSSNNNNNNSNTFKNQPRNGEPDSRTITTNLPKQSLMQEQDRKHNLRREERKQSATTADKMPSNKQMSPVKLSSTAAKTNASASALTADEVMREARLLVADITANLNDSPTSHPKSSRNLTPSNFVQIPTIEATSAAPQDEQRASVVPPPPGFTLLPTESKWSEKKNTKRWSATKKIPTPNNAEDTKAAGIVSNDKGIISEKVRKNHSFTEQATNVMRANKEEICENEKIKKKKSKSSHPKSNSQEKENCIEEIKKELNQKALSHEEEWLSAWLNIEWDDDKPQVKQTQFDDNTSDEISGAAADAETIRKQKTLRECLIIPNDKSLLLPMMKIQKDCKEISDEFSTPASSLASRKMFTKLF